VVAGELWWTDELNPARELVAAGGGCVAGAVRARGEGRSRKCDAGRALRELKPWPAVPELPRRVDAVSGRRRRVAPRGGQALTRSGARRGAGARRQARRGAGLGRGEAKRGARGRLAGPASAGGPEARRRPRKIEIEFFNLFSRNF